MPFLLLLACYVRDPAAPPDPVTLTDPTLASLSVSCSVDDGEWALEADTTSWSAGATLTWTLDGSYVEQHGLSSTGAAADGSSDTLEGEIGIVSDWRDASSGSTVFFCSDTPAAVLTIEDAAAETITDCVFFGADPELLEGLEGLPTNCPFQDLDWWTDTGDSADTSG